MATLELTEQDQLTIVKLLAQGRTVDFVAQATTLSEDAVLTVAASHGHPDQTKLRWAADIMQGNLDRQARKELPRAELRRRAAAAPVLAAPTPAAQPQPASAKAEDPAPDPSEFDRLVELGANSATAKTRTLAKRLRETLGQLRDAIDAEAADRERLQREKVQREQTMAEIAALEKKLKAARAKLGRPIAATRERTRQGEVQDRYGVKAQDIRDWAVLNGHQIGTAGRIPAAVLDAYEAGRA